MPSRTDAPTKTPPKTQPKREPRREHRTLPSRICPGQKIKLPGEGAPHLP